LLQEEKNKSVNQNLEIALREVGDFRIVLPFGVWVIGVAPKRVRKMI